MSGFWAPFFSPPVLLERCIHFGRQRGVSKLHAGSQPLALCRGVLGLTGVMCILKVRGTGKEKGPLPKCPQQVETWEDLTLTPMIPLLGYFVLELNCLVTKY